MNLLTFPRLFSRPLGMVGAGSGGPLVFLDDFARSDGAVGNDWNGETFAIASGKVVNTPTLGSEVLNDGGLETWATATNLTSWDEGVTGGNTINQEATEIHGGTYSANLLYTAGGSVAYIMQTLPTVKTFYHCDFWAKAPVGKGIRVGHDNAAGEEDGNLEFVGTGDWQNQRKTLRTASVSKFVRLNRGVAAYANGTSLYYDDVSVKPLTTAQLFLTRPVYPTADYLIEVTISALERGTMAGMVVALDDPTTPANYVTIFHNDAKLWVKKVLAASGDFTTVGSKAQAFSAGDKITIAKLGDQLKVYLNDVAIAAAFTLDAALKDNLYAGVFSTYSGNQLDDWSEQVKPLGGSTAFLAPFFSGAVDGAIFAIGDSITAGSTDEVTGLGYPPLLSDLMAVQTRGYWREITPRGGHGGYDILDIAAVIDADLAATSGTATKVFCLLGANDVVDTADHWQSFDETSWKAAYQYVIDAVSAKWPAAAIYLCKSYRAGAYTAHFADLSAWIDDLLAANPGVCFAGPDTTSIFNGHQAVAYGGSEPYLLVDDVHPNHAGFVALAEAINDLV